MSPIHAPNTLDSQDTPQKSFRHPTGTNKTPLDTTLAYTREHREKKKTIE